MCMGPCLEYRPSFNEEERDELLRVLEGSLVETHAEMQRNMVQGHRQHVSDEEMVIRTLVEKLRNCPSEPD